MNTDGFGEFSIMYCISIPSLLTSSTCVDNAPIPLNTDYFAITTGDEPAKHVYNRMSPGVMMAN
jgi:hypothetical protein